MLVPVFKARVDQEHSLVRDKSINADVMWCLQSVPTFHRYDPVTRLPSHDVVGEDDLVGQRYATHALHRQTLSECTDVKYRLTPKRNKAHPYPKSKIK